MNLNLLTTWNFKVRLIRLIEGRLQPIDCDISADLDFDPMDGDHSHLVRMRTWVDEILDGCVAFNVNCEMDTSLLVDISNHIMFCPDEPHDYLLLALINAKLNAIGRGAVRVVNTRLSVDPSAGFVMTLEGDTDQLLPSGEEWMGEIRYWDQPWWNRPDGGMMDLTVDEGEDPLQKPDILIDLDGEPEPPLGIVFKPDMDDQPTATAEIIRPDFRRRSRDD